jgi:hypothetical protein
MFFNYTDLNTGRTERISFGLFYYKSFIDPEGKQQNSGDYIFRP